MNIYQHHVRPLVAWLARLRPHPVYLLIYVCVQLARPRAKRRSAFGCYLEFIALGEHRTHRPAINIILSVRDVLLAFPNTAVKKTTQTKVNLFIKFHLFILL